MKIERSREWWMKKAALEVDPQIKVAIYNEHGACVGVKTFPAGSRVFDFNLIIDRHVITHASIDEGEKFKLSPSTTTGPDTITRITLDAPEIRVLPKDYHLTERLDRIEKLLLTLLEKQI